MADTTPGSAPSNNRNVMIVLSYLWLLALVPLLTEKDDKEVQWHAKHGIVLMLAEIVFWIALTIVQMALGTFREGITYEDTERWRGSAQLNRRVLVGARLLAAQQDEAAAGVLVAALRDAAKVPDATVYLDALCDVGALLASRPSHREAGLALLAQAARLAEISRDARGVQTATDLLALMRAAVPGVQRMAGSSAPGRDTGGGWRRNAVAG